MMSFFIAEKGSGAELNSKQLAISEIESLADAMVCTGFNPDDFDVNGPYFRAMSYKAQAVRRDGSAALDLANVAAGRFDGFWEFGLHSWDVAAGSLIITEAGGTVTAIDGSPHQLDGRSILASNGRIHTEMQQVLLSP